MKPTNYDERDLTPEHTLRGNGHDSDAPIRPQVAAAYEYVDAVVDTADIESGGAPACHACVRAADIRRNGLRLDFAMLIVCPDCGNKRCPKASDHLNTCTGSNEPNQAGSVFGGVCIYPDCHCPFDAPADPNWCAKGLPHLRAPN